MIVILGIMVGEFVRGLILASAGGVEGVPTLAKVAKGAVVIIAVFMALQQVGVAEEIVTTAFTLILGAVALAAGLAFGLGNRDAGRRDHPALVRGGPEAGPAENRSGGPDVDRLLAGVGRDRVVRLPGP